MHRRINATAIDPLKRPLRVGCTAGFKDTAKANQGTPQIEIGVIHGHVFRVRRVLVDQGITAVTEVNAGPCPVRLKQVSAVVLRTADAEVAVRWVESDALELGRAKRGGVAIDPSHACISRLPDPTVVTGVDN